MNNVHSLEEVSVARLRARLGETEQERDNLIAFAQGHRGAVASIHRAVLAALECDPVDLPVVVTGDWPAILGIDAASLVIVDGAEASLASSAGCHPVDSALVRRLLRSSPLSIRSVERGNPLFGPAAPAIRAEALVRFDCGDDGRWGVLLLGQQAAFPVDPRRGGELLLFLGRSLGAMIGRWQMRAID